MMEGEGGEREKKKRYLWIGCRATKQSTIRVEGGRRLVREQGEE